MNGEDPLHEVRIVQLLECDAHTEGETVLMRPVDERVLPASPDQEVPFGATSTDYVCPRCGRRATLRNLAQIVSSRAGETVELRIGLHSLGTAAADRAVLEARRSGTYTFAVTGQAAATIKEARFTVDAVVVGIDESEARVHVVEEEAVRSLGLPAGITLTSVPFDEYVQALDPDAAPMILALVQQWDVLTDELGRAPSTGEYIDRWPGGPAGWGPQAELRAFGRLFPEEVDPQRIVRALWSAVGDGIDFVELVRVPVPIDGSFGRATRA